MRAETTARERFLWSCLLAVNVVTHLASLGARAVSHDESLHAYYSYELATTGHFRHDPMMHGPFLFHVTAATFRILGDSEATARLPQALAGIALVPALFLCRRLLGRKAAFLAAALASASPSILFYGRYARNDVFMALFAVAWMLGALRYLQTRRHRFLVLAAVAQSLSFCAKETAFLTGLSFGSFFAALALVRVARGEERLRESPSAHLAFVMAANVLPFLTAFVHRLAGWNPADFDSPEARGRAAVLVPAALAVSALAAAAFCRRAGGRGLPFRTWVAASAAFWVTPLALFTTFYTNVPRGLTSGLVGSLGYWLGQHGVARGGQPWFYYLLLAALYEPLTVGLALAAAAGAALRFAVRRGRCDVVTAFLAWWTASSLAAYSLAGEKMPWLLVHVALPSCLLAARALARAVDAASGRVPSARAAVLLAAPTALAAAAAPLLWRAPSAGSLAAAVAATRLLTQGLALGALAAAAWWALRGLRRRDTLRLLGLGACGTLALFTARSALRLTFVNFDRASELLVYAHGTPDLTRTRREIEAVAQRTGLGAELPVAFDDDAAWPITWYLRRYRQQRYLSGEDLAGPRLLAPVAIVGSKNLPDVEGRLAADYVRRDYRLIWWPLEGYDAPLGELLGSLGDPARRRWLARYVFTRETGHGSADWPLRHDFALFVRRDLAPAAPPAATAAPAPSSRPLVETFELAPRAIWSDVYALHPLAEPAAVAIGPDRLRYVADTGNDRIVVLDAAGAFVRSFGSSCRLARGGCPDPDGDGPLQMGDGQLMAPAGIGVAPDGTVLVADTGNGRIVLFDRLGRFLRNWSRLPGAPVSPRLFDDPRGIAVDAAGGRVAVADTGHDRVLLFAPDGRLTAELGGPGKAAGRFAAPVGVAFGADGTLHVADAANRRLQRFDAALAGTGEWPVESWSAAVRPSVAATGAGAVYASDPAGGRVLAFAVTGDLAGALTVPEAQGGRRFRPAGLALDEERGELLVADPAGGRIVVLPIGGGRPGR
ncbi:MAG: flippase activity-associated protein Agl23 [Vicinamibacteria bacterium]